MKITRARALTQPHKHVGLTAIFFNLEREKAGLNKEILLNGGVPEEAGRREGSAQVGATGGGHIKRESSCCILAKIMKFAF